MIVNHPSDTPTPEQTPPAAVGGADRKLLLACGGEAALVALAWLLAWLFGLPLGELAWPAEKQVASLLVGLLATLPMLGFLLWMLKARWQPIADLRAQVQQTVGGLLDGASLEAIFAIAIMAGVGEELLFRGALQPLFTQWLTPWTGQSAGWLGVLIASVLFGLAHPMSRTYIIIAGIGGLYLGALAYLRGEILSATVAHAAYDVAALMCLRATRPSDAVVADDNADA